MAGHFIDNSAYDGVSCETEKIVSQTNPKVLQAHKHETWWEFLKHSHRQCSFYYIFSVLHRTNGEICLYANVDNRNEIYFRGLFMFSMSWFRIPIGFVVEVCMKKCHMWVRCQALKIANGDDNGAIKCDHFKTTW